MSTGGFSSSDKARIVQHTGVYTAYLRALETCREDEKNRLIEDPFASNLAQAAGNLMPLVYKWTQESHLQSIQDLLAIRTRYLDEALNKRDESIQQVVILAAGLDARVYRLESLTQAKVYEIDRFEDTFNLKKQVIEEQMDTKPKSKEYTCIAADLSQDQWSSKLLDHGFDPSVPTFWCLEGLVSYLDPQAIVRLLKQIDTLSAKKSTFLVDICGKAALSPNAFDSKIAELFQFGEDDPLNGIFRKTLDVHVWKLHLQAKLETKGTRHFGRIWEPLTNQNDPTQITPISILMGTKN
jgi:methyltransferase (TIGR00027 family)